MMHAAKSVQPCCALPGVIEERLFLPGKEHRFLVTLRDPIAVLESEYFHVTPSENVSQAGLENYARQRAPDVFLAQVDVFCVCMGVAHVA